MAAIESLAEHRQRLDNEAETIVGDAIRLKVRLKNAINVPLPEQETDDLIRALAVFQAAIERCAR